MRHGFFMMVFVSVLTRALARRPQALPKTRSGKIMRRVLRKIVAQQTDEIGDVSTLADPSVVEVLIEKVNRMLVAKS